MEEACALAQKRIELLPQLAREFSQVIPAEFFVPGALPADVRSHPARPLISYLVHRVFLCAAQRSANLRQAAAALCNAHTLCEGLDTTPVWRANGAGIDVLWTLPLLPPGLDAIPVGIPSSANRAEFLLSVRGGLELIRKTCPALARKLSSELRWIVPMPEEKEGRHSMTLANFPGTVFVGARSQPDRMAELIVHEYLHLVLHAAGEVLPLIEGDSAGPDLYSPWREDARPAEGLLHGIYVFTGVMMFWLGHLQEPGPRCAYAQERVALLRLQLHKATQAMEERYSGKIVDRVLDSTRRSASLAQTAPIAPEVVIEAEQRVDHHYQQWLMRH